MNFSRETIILTIMLVKLGIILALTLIVLKQGDYYELKLKGVKEYCIGKENRLDFCSKLMSSIK